MNSSELPNALRELADRIEAGKPTGGDCEASVHVYFIRDREHLKSWVQLMDEPEADAGGCSRWVSGKTGSTKITAFYQGDLLDKEVEKVEIVTREVNPQAGLQKLLEETNQESLTEA